MFRYPIAVVLILSSLMACATLPKQNPKAEARLQEANAALESLSVDSTTFYGNLVTLMERYQSALRSPGLD